MLHSTYNLKRYKLMNIDSLEKDESIKEVIKKLYNELGKDSFIIVDHWEADLNAIGIDSPSNNGVLVYISINENEKDSYYVSLELPPSSEIDLPYTGAGEFNSVNFEKLVEIIRKHFNENSL